MHGLLFVRLEWYGYVWAWLYRKPLVGSGWAVSLLLCMKWLRKQSSHLLANASISSSEVFSQSGRVVVGQECWLLSSC